MLNVTWRNQYNIY